MTEYRHHRSEVVMAITTNPGVDVGGSRDAEARSPGGSDVGYRLGVTVVGMDRVR